MNCKPGDLAFIVNSNDSRNIGKLVKVLSQYKDDSTSWWITCDSVLHGLFSDWPPGSEVGQHDRNLRPIRDPGENAKDETLSWLPSPTLETA